MRKVGYIAFDQGPKATLEALESRLHGTWLLRSDMKPATRAISVQGIELLVCGTSDTSTGRAVEAGARKAARELGVPLILVEDFPGSYAAVPEGQPDLLFVDSEFSATLAKGKERSLRVEVCPSVRYDGLRRRLGELRRQTGEGSDKAVLWIGQPETRDSLETLKRLLPALAAHGVTLWFRAHPRDEGYARGAYTELFATARLATEDLTSSPLEDCLSRRPELVLTQFSSVGIEAGFWGICTLNVLFADLGRRTLAAKKGYAVPPWCDEGAAFLMRHEADVEAVLGRALTLKEARAQVVQSFDRYFMVHEEGSQKLINVLYNHRFL